MTSLGHALLAAACAVLLAYYLAAEKIPAGDGFGWDGVNYARWVVDPRVVFDRSTLHDYQAQRILPSLLIGLPAHLLGVEPGREYVLTGFAVANAACVYVTGLFWTRACASAGLGGARALAGMLLAVVGFATVKNASYYPVLTDLFALASGAVLLDSWLRRREVLLALTVFASMFVWPSTWLVGALLLLLPRGVVTEARISRLTAAALAVVVALAAAAAAWRLGATIRFEPLPAPQRSDLLPLSAVAVAVYVACVAFGWIRAAAGASTRLRFPVPPLSRWIVCLAVIGGARAVQKVLAPDEFLGVLTTRRLLMGSVNRPAIFAAASFSYFGALAALLAVRLPGALSAASRVGAALVAVVAFGLGLGLFPESRMELNVVPFAALAVALAVPFEQMNAVGWAFLVACQAGVAKWWLTVGASADDFGTPESLLVAPAQRYFLSQGPWMADGPYFVQLTIAAIAAIGAHILIPRTAAPVHPADETDPSASR